MKLIRVIFSVIGIILLAMIGIQFLSSGGVSTEIDSNRFLQILKRGDIEKIVIVNKEKVEIYIKPDRLSDPAFDDIKLQKTNTVLGQSIPQYYFNIISQDVFVGELNQVMNDLPPEYQPTYTTVIRRNYFGEILVFILTVMIIFFGISIFIRIILNMRSRVRGDKTNEVYQKSEIASIKSDILSTGLRFYNHFSIVLYEKKLKASQSFSFGLIKQEKVFDLENIDSIYSSVGISFGQLIFGLIFFAIGIFGLGEELDSPIILPILSIVFGILLFVTGFMYRRLIIKSFNDQMSIQTRLTKKEMIRSFIDMVHAQKDKIKNRETMSENDFINKIEKLKTLLNEGLITEQEFKTKKAEILRRI